MNKTVSQYWKLAVSAAVVGSLIFAIGCGGDGDGEGGGACGTSRSNPCVQPSSDMTMYTWNEGDYGCYYYLDANGNQLVPNPNTNPGQYMCNNGASNNDYAAFDYYYGNR